MKRTLLGLGTEQRVQVERSGEVRSGWKPMSPFLPKLLSNIHILGNSLMFQWLGLNAFTATGPGLMPGCETKIPQASQGGRKKKKKKLIVKKKNYLKKKQKRKYFKIIILTQHCQSTICQ